MQKYLEQKTMRCIALLLLPMMYSLYVNPARAGVIFDVTSASYGSGGTAVGSSNGIGWTLSPTFIWDQASTTADNWAFFGDPTFHNPPMVGNDAIHIGGDPFDFTFDTPISSVVIYLWDNPSPPSDGHLDFGITPIVISGQIGVSGTEFWSNSNGGIVRLDNINSNVLSHINTASTGGVSIALSVIPAPPIVPEPTSFTMFGSAIVLLIGSRRRKR